MRNIEVDGRMAEDGNIILPPGALDEIGVKPGSLVHISCQNAGPFGRNDWLGEEAELVIPHDLLEAAHIPLDSGLVVQMVPGAILIGDEDPMNAVRGPLLEIISLFGISEEEVEQAIEEGGYYDE
ncbi:hypothetical protein [Hungatella effluvii]|uniref:hypothetical protein n=1 Tax=Hungatella effluvii TaxID=1096246 RepID=UPI0022E4085F|nr:hypothetical protein [Hungatella effluvii]